MKTIQTKAGEVLLVKVPEDVSILITEFGIHLSKNNFKNSETITEFKVDQIIGKFSELEDKDLTKEICKLSEISLPLLSNYLVIKKI
jgi:hypothetical protein